MIYGASMVITGESRSSVSLNWARTIVVPGRFVPLSESNWMVVHSTKPPPLLYVQVVGASDPSPGDVNSNVISTGDVTPSAQT